MILTVKSTQQTSFWTALWVAAQAHGAWLALTGTFPLDICCDDFLMLRELS